MIKEGLKICGGILFLLSMVFSGSIFPDLLWLKYNNPWFLLLHLPIIIWMFYGLMDINVRKAVRK